MNLTLVVAGQSNGTSSTNNRMPKVYSRTEKVCIHHSFPVDTPTENVDAIPVKGMPGTGQCGPLDNSASWIFLGDMIQERFPNKWDIIKFVNISQGGSTSKDWVLNPPNWCNRLQTHVDNFNADAVLWVQGESDKNLPGTESVNDRISYMTQIITAARTASGKERIPFFVALDGWATDGGWGTTSAQIEAMPIRQAQRGIMNSRIAWLGPDIDEMRYQTPRNNWFQGLSGNPYPGAEFEGLGLIAHAEAWFKVMKPWLDRI